MHKLILISWKKFHSSYFLLFINTYWKVYLKWFIFWNLLLGGIHSFLYGTKFSTREVNQCQILVWSLFMLRKIALLRPVVSLRWLFDWYTLVYLRVLSIIHRHSHEQHVACKPPPMQISIIEKWQYAHSFHFFLNYTPNNCVIVFDPTII